MPVDDMMSQYEQDSVFDDGGMIEAGYQHEYVKYSREHIMEVCSNMVDIIKPDTYKELEKTEDAMSLFREEPCREWAPLPSMEPLFPTDEKRGAEDAEAADGSDWNAASWNRTTPRKRQGRSHNQGLETYHEEADWAEDPSWGWDSWGKGWDSKPRWVEKGKGREDEEGGEGESGPRPLTWAEKVRGSEGAYPRWVPKKNTEPEPAKKAEVEEGDKQEFQ